MKSMLNWVAIFLIVVMRSANASTGWVCDQSFISYDGQKPVEEVDHLLEKYAVNGNKIDTVPDPAPPPQTRAPLLPQLEGLPDEWDILVNNPTGLVAIQTEADIPSDSSKTTVWSDVLLIDKINLKVKEFDGSAEDNERTITSGVCKAF